MNFAYFTPKSGNLNILGSYNTQVSKPGPTWPSCFESIAAIGFKVCLNIQVNELMKLNEYQR